MHMFSATYLQHITYRMLGVMCVSACFFAGLAVATAEAVVDNTPVVILTVENADEAEVGEGAPVTLRWEARNVTNCSIDNGIGVIPLSELPVGSRVVIPSEDGVTTTYTLSCLGGSSQVRIYVKPYIPLIADSPVILDDDGVGRVWVSWYGALHFTHCTYLDQRGLLTGQTKRIGLATSNDPAGRVAREITVTEPTEVTVTCINTVLDTENSNSITIQTQLPDNTPPPPMLITFLESEPEHTINVDPNWAEARATIRYAVNYPGEYGDICIRKAYHEGEEVNVKGWSFNDIWWSTNVLSSVASFPHDLSPVTLTLRCGREDHEDSWDEKELTLYINNEYGDGGPDHNDPSVHIEAPDSVTFPAVVITTPVLVNTDASFVTSCQRGAEDASGNPITLSGWTNVYTSALNSTLSVNISSTVKLTILCTRAGDGVVVTDEHTINVVRIEDDFDPELTVTAADAGVDEFGVPRAQIGWESEYTTSCPSQTATVLGYALPGLPVEQWGGKPTSWSGTLYIYGDTYVTVTCVQSSTGKEITRGIWILYDEGTGEMVIEDSADVPGDTGPGDDSGGPSDPDDGSVGTPPLVTLTAAPNKDVVLDTEVTLEWTVDNADYCVANDSTGGTLWGGEVSPTNDSTTVLMDDSDIAFILTCANEYGSTPRQVLVTALDLAATMTLTANPPVVRQGNKTELEWAADPSLTCSILANGLLIPDTGDSTYSGLTGDGGDSVESPITNAETVFTLNCDGVAEAPPEATARVRVLPFIRES